MLAWRKKTERRTLHEIEEAPEKCEKKNYQNRKEEDRMEKRIVYKIIFCNY